MAHRFVDDDKDPYSTVAHHVEAHMFSGGRNIDRGAQEEAYDVLTEAIVTALGDIAAQAFRYGVNDPRQIRGLAAAVAHSADVVLRAYRGEVDPEPALRALDDDHRSASLNETDRQQLQREIERTRQLEHLVLTARRLPALLTFAGSLGLHVPEDILDNATLLVGDHPTPNAEQQQRQQ